MDNLTECNQTDVPALDIYRDVETMSSTPFHISFSQPRMKKNNTSVVACIREKIPSGALTYRTSLEIDSNCFSFVYGVAQALAPFIHTSSYDLKSLPVETNSTTSITATKTLIKLNEVYDAPSFDALSALFEHDVAHSDVLFFDKADASVLKEDQKTKSKWISPSGVKVGYLQFEAGDGGRVLLVRSLVSLAANPPSFSTSHHEDAAAIFSDAQAFDNAYPRGVYVMIRSTFPLFRHLPNQQLQDDVIKSAVKKRTILSGIMDIARECVKKEEDEHVLSDLMVDICRKIVRVNNVDTDDETILIINSTGKHAQLKTTYLSHLIVSLIPNAFDRGLGSPYNLVVMHLLHVLTKKVDAKGGVEGVDLQSMKNLLQMKPI